LSYRRLENFYHFIGCLSIRRTALPTFTFRKAAKVRGKKEIK